MQWWFKPPHIPVIPGGAAGPMCLGLTTQERKVWSMCSTTPPYNNRGECSPRNLWWPIVGAEHKLVSCLPCSADGSKIPTYDVLEGMALHIPRWA